NGDNIKISIDDNSPIYSFANDSTGKSVQEKVNFSEIKIGDNLNITIKLLADGKIQVQSVLVLLSGSGTKLQ
ncbi:MAG: hypothetical protein Q7R49_05710, partial [Candidatus Daviesbacteria bacterium]|nr:hypothetical protein [Candidatus Daviesbacteria bacterium]